MKKPKLKDVSSKPTNGDILTLYTILITGEKNAKGTKLVYALSRTIGKLKPVAEALSREKCIPESDTYKDYLKKLDELNQKSSNGKIVVVGDRQHYDFPWFYDPAKYAGAQQVHTAAFEKLKATFKEAIDERDSQIKEYNEFLNEEFGKDEGVEFGDYLHLISKEDADSCEMPDSLRTVIYHIIKE